MISIGGIGFVPSPSINVSPEYFYYDKTIIGGYLNLEIIGTHHAEDRDAYNDKISRINGLVDTCARVNISPNCGSTIDVLDGCMGVVRDVRISDGGSELNFNYTIIVECSKDSTKGRIIQNQSPVPFYDHIDKKAIVQSYSETLTVDYTNVNLFSVDDALRLTKSPGKMTVNIDLGLYDNDQCDSNGIDYNDSVSKFLTARANELVGDPSLLKIGLDNKFKLCGINSSSSYRKTGGSVNFDLYIVPSTQNMAIVEFSTSQESDQITGYATAKIRGSITGLDSKETLYSGSNDAFDNAKTVYNKIRDYGFYADLNKILKNACLDQTLPISEPSTVGGGGGLGTPDPDQRQQPEGTCYKLINTRVSEYPSSNKIDFEMTYKDVEKCELLGYSLSSRYEEKSGISRVEHLIPGQGSYGYYSGGSKAPRYSLTVEGKLPNSCLQQSVGKLTNIDSGTTIDTVKTAVGEELTKQKNNLKLNQGNILRTNRSETTGRYSYAITEEYIECQ